jgi:hypothetical protein
MRGLICSIGCTVLLANFVPGAAATAQDQCTLPTTNEWLAQASSGAPATQVEADKVVPVSKNITKAVARLRDHSVVPLGTREMQEFIDLPTSPSAGLRPYLVRAVFPTANPSLDLRWDGVRLDVFAGGLGCAPYVKHPVVVFLERQPKHVFVMASAAL